MLADTFTLLGSPTSPGSIAILGLLLLGCVYLLQDHPSHPVVNPKQGWEFGFKNAQRRFFNNSKQYIADGLKKYNVFNVVTENGYRLVLGSQYAQEIRAHKDLNFAKAIAQEFHTGIPGFEPFGQGTTGDDIIQDAVRMKLTQSLGHVTKPLSEETALALEKNWTDNNEWHTIPLKRTILDIVAQLSSKVFLGDQVCRNPDWLRITVAYTVDCFMAAEKLRWYPKFSRRIVAKFLPETRKVKAELQESRDIINPVLAKRKAEKEAAFARGEQPPNYNDALEWMEVCAKGRPYDAAVAQLSMSLAAIHTTSDLLTQVLYDICAHEGLVDEMREEVLTVIKAEGWQKTTLYKLRLMDSVIKESQRVKPNSIATMRRLAEQKITLSDGTVIPKNTSLMVSSDRMWDESFYTNAQTFDPYRYLKLREQPGHETSAQLVSPSPEHMGFGFGKHACPGRFFAANELKIALCHILLKYDFRLPKEWQGDKVKPIVRGLSLSSEHRAEMEIRRRQEEIEL
ncbi:cytochrome P450 [Aspergillus unguis]